MATKSKAHTNNHLVVTILKLKTKLSVGEVRPCFVKLDQRRNPKDFFGKRGFITTVKQSLLDKFEKFLFIFCQKLKIA